jgi:nitrate/nitrite transporter NarK
VFRFRQRDTENSGIIICGAMVGFGGAYFVVNCDNDPPALVAV